MKTMKIPHESLARRWARIGGLAGLGGIVCYLCAAFAPLPQALSLAMAFAFGPLLMVGFLGLSRCLQEERASPWPQAATVLACAAGATLLLMLSMQQAIFISMEQAIAEAKTDDAKAIAQAIFSGLNSVQLGADVAWDVLIAAAMFLFGISMWAHRAFGRIISVLGVSLASLLVGYNIYYFPTPPIDSGSVDWGPFCALWLLVVFVMLVLASRSRPNVRGA